MTKINYNGKMYDLETVKNYYDIDICEQIHTHTDTEQEFFEKYIELDPGFLDLFKYDLSPID